MHGTVDEFFDGTFWLEDVEVVIADVAGVVEFGVRLGVCMQASPVDGGIFLHGSFDISFLTVLLVVDIVYGDQVLSIPDEDWIMVHLTEAVAGPVRARVVGVPLRWWVFFVNAHDKCVGW
jgi:hypothetical protein